jgi:hypothetical protein
MKNILLHPFKTALGPVAAFVVLFIISGLWFNTGHPSSRTVSTGTGAEAMWSTTWVLALLTLAALLAGIIYVLVRKVRH